MSHENALRLELLRPHEIRAALAARSLVYLPLGTIEWHCEHLPVGLDALTAHGICLRAAKRTGGLVHPVLHYGTGGGHAAYPWTVMLETGAEIAALLGKSLARLDDFGVRQAVLFSGHFADGQLEMIARLARDWNAGGHRMQVLALAVNQAEGTGMGPDHAGVFETTLLHALWPERVDISRLAAPAGSEVEDGWSAARHDPDHPLWGIVGPDPRGWNPDAAGPLLEAVVRWLAAKVGPAA